MYYLRVLSLIILKVNLISLFQVVIFKKTKIISLDQYRFLVRNFMDLYILIETLFIKVYPLDLTINNPVIIDVGASLGDFSVYCSKNYPGSTVHAIEPEKSSFKILSDNINLNNCHHIITHQLALSNSQNLVKLSVNSSNYGHSNSFATGTTQKVKAVSLQQFFQDQKINICHLLKSDCEGAEYDYLLNSTSEVLSKIEKIVMEYHLFTPDQVDNFPKLVKHLESNNFYVSTSPNPVNSTIGYLVASK